MSAFLVDIAIRIVVGFSIAVMIITVWVVTLWIP
jgi:hypothetical protein